MGKFNGAAIVCIVKYFNFSVNDSNLFDDLLQATREDTVASLTGAVDGFTLKNSRVGTFIKNDCNLRSDFKQTWII